MPTEPVITPPNDAALTLVTLGGFALSDHTGAQRLGPGKPLALLAYLACSPARTASREQLIDLLWADSDPERARHALRQALWQLRHALGDGSLTGKEEVHLDSPIETDRARFLDAIEQGDLGQALEHYQGPFLAAFASPGGVSFEHWADAEREHLRSAFLHAADLMARRHLATGQPREAAQLARRMIAADPLGQSGRRLLIEAHLGAGDTVSAATDAAALERWAATEETELEPASLAVLRRARSRNGGEQADLPDTTPTAGGLVADLVGREAEFATILAAWVAARHGSPAHLHLVAPAGLGKTRLLLDLEARLRSTGARVRYVRANPGDREIPGALASEVARALASLPGAMAVAPAVAATLVALDPSLANTYQAAADTATGDEATRRRVLALADLVRATSDEGAFAFLIDDLHWSDNESLTLIEALIVRLAKSPVLVVSATRPHGDRQLRSEQRVTLTLTPLTVRHVAALLDSLAEFDDSDTAASIATQLHSASDGNPLLVLELLQLASERETLRIVADRWSVAAGGDESNLFGSGDGIRQRFERLGPDARRVLTMLAVAGSPLTIPTIAHAMELADGMIAEQLLVLDRQGFAHETASGWQPAHDEIAAVAADISIEACDAVHQRLGHALEAHADGSTTSLARAARHYAAVRDAASIARLVAHRLDHARTQHEPLTAPQLLAQMVGSTTVSDIGPAVTRLLPFRHRHRLAPLFTLTAAAVALAAFIGWNRHQESVHLAAITARSVVFEALWQDDTSLVTRVARLTIDPTRWDPASPPRFGPPMDRKAPGINWSMLSRYDPSGTRLLGSSVIDPDNPGGQDVLLLEGNRVQRLASFPRDDVDPSFTPDGRGMVFVTTRWAPADRDDYDIAYMAFGDSIVRPIVDDRSGESTPRISPDGTRVAYIRNRWDHADQELCVVHFDGSGPDCETLPLFSWISLDDWLDNDHLLVRGQRDGKQHLFRVGVQTLEATPLLDLEAFGAVIDQGREFLLCTCINPSNDRLQLYLHSLRSGSGAWIDSPTDFAIIRTIAVKSREAPRYLDSLAIQSEGVVVPGDHYQLRTQGFDQFGMPFAFDTTARRWRVLSGPARIDSLTGALTPTDTGMVAFEVTAGGWRSARDSFHVVPASTLLLTTEDWNGTLSDKPWRSFDSPLPRLAASSVLGPVLLPNGDRTSPSGLYSIQTWEPSEGLTLEWRMTTPLTLPVHQNVGIEFRAANDSVVLVGWNHLGGGPPGLGNSRLGQCGVGYPAGEGFPNWTDATLVVQNRSSRIPVPSDQPIGAAHTWRLTVFPDGTCGLAIDSVPVGRTRGSISFKWPLRLWVMGQSEGTDIAVGALKIWRGDPGGVDWDAPRAAGPPRAPQF